MKKIFFFVLFIFIIAEILTICSAPAFAEEWKCGSEVKCTLDFKTGEMRFSGNGEMESVPTTYWVTYPNYKIHWLKEYVKAVIIEPGITNIPDYAFSDFKILSNIIIPDSIISIGEKAFWNCSSLEKITLPSDIIEIGPYAFAGCSNIKDIDIPDGIRKISSYTFYNSGISEIVIPEGVKTIGYSAFSGCKKLSKITLPSSLEKIEKNAFEDCEGLSEIVYNDSIAQLNHIIVTEGNEALFAAEKIASYKKSETGCKNNIFVPVSAVIAVAFSIIILKRKRPQKTRRFPRRRCRL